MTAGTSGTKKARLTAKQWAEAEALWAAGNITLDGLAAKFKVDRSTFNRHFVKKGIVKGSKQDEQAKAIAAKVAADSVAEATLVAARIRETKEEHYKMSSALAKLTWNEILKTKQDGTPVSTALNNLKALDSAMNVLKKAREERWAVLGLDRPDAVDPDELPELIVSELTAEQIKQLRDREFNELDAIEDTKTKSKDRQSEDDDDDDESLDGVVEEG